MVSFKSRDEVVPTKKIISSELAKMQKIAYDEDVLQFYKDTDEEQLFWEQFDCLKNEIINYNTYYKIITLGHSEIDTFIEKLTEKLKELFQVIKATNFIVIPYLKRDFFGNRDNTSQPLRDAYKKLEQIVGNRTFNGAFTFGSNDLPDFLEILFWTTRCDPGVAEYVYLFDEDENIQLQLCQYGNIHLTEFTAERFTGKILKSLGWTIIDGREWDNFSHDRIITGRQIKL